MEQDDATLVAEFARTQSESAFATLVQRHVNLVFSTALRQVQNRGLAEEISQKVFLLLATKSSKLHPKTVVGGWLYHATCRIALETLRRERRRHFWERKAMETFEPSDPSSNWKQVAPVLDEAIAALEPSDRDAVVMRYFENQPFQHVAAALGISEDAAQKRVSRALDRMRAMLARRGVSVSTSALALMISGSAVQTAPQALATSISATAAAAAAATASAGAGGFNFIGGNLMSLFSVKGGLKLAGAAAAATFLVVQQNEIGNLLEQNAQSTSQNRTVQLEPQERPAASASEAELIRLRRDAAEVHRLRAEIARLRNDAENTARLQAELDRLAAHAKNLEQQRKDNQPELSSEQIVERANNLLKMDYAKRWMLAFVLCAEKNGGLCPVSFSEASPFYPDDPSAQGLAAPLQSGMWEIVYAGKLNDISFPARTIVLREKTPRPDPRGGFVRAYGFADGHSELHYSPDENAMVTWEAQRLAQRPNLDP